MRRATPAAFRFSSHRNRCDRPPPREACWSPSEGRQCGDPSAPRLHHRATVGQTTCSSSTTTPTIIAHLAVTRDLTAARRIRRRFRLDKGGFAMASGCPARSRALRSADRLLIASRRFDDGRNVVKASPARVTRSCAGSGRRMQRDVINQLGRRSLWLVGSCTSVLSSQCQPSRCWVSRSSRPTTHRALTRSTQPKHGTRRRYPRWRPNLPRSGEVELPRRGEFPVPSGYTCYPFPRLNNNPWKKFFVGLTYPACWEAASPQCQSELSSFRRNRSSDPVGRINEPHAHDSSIRPPRRNDVGSVRRRWRWPS